MTFGRDKKQGFLSIAQANYSTSSGRRYGQDFYDDRMKALKGVYVLSTRERKAEG